MRLPRAIAAAVVLAAVTASPARADITAFVGANTTPPTARRSARPSGWAC